MYLAPGSSLSKWQRDKNLMMWIPYLHYSRKSLLNIFQIHMTWGDRLSAAHKCLKRCKTMIIVQHITLTIELYHVSRLSPLPKLVISLNFLIRNICRLLFGYPRSRSSEMAMQILPSKTTVSNVCQMSSRPHIFLSYSLMMEDTIIRAHIFSSQVRHDGTMNRYPL